MYAELTNHVVAILLASLRLAPLLAFSPPFTLVTVPPIVRAAIVVALAASLTSNSTAMLTDTGQLLIAACGELALGLALSLPLQLAFGLIGVAGRALDIQAGFGLAFLIDPKTKAQMPLIGALFTYAAAAIFFLTNGPADLITVLAAGFARLPVGATAVPDSPSAVLAFLATASVMSVGLVGLATIVLFLIDLAVAMLSRTLPQMNVLVFGLQIKALVTLLLLPATIAYAGAGMIGLIRLAIETMPAMG